MTTRQITTLISEPPIGDHVAERLDDYLAARRITGFWVIYRSRNNHVTASPGDRRGGPYLTYRGDDRQLPDGHAERSRMGWTKAR